MKTHMKWLVPRLIADTLAMTLMGAASSQDILTYSGTDQQVKLVVNARKEGKLTVYSSMAVNQLLRSLIEGFTKKYPFIQANFWCGSSHQVVQKVLAEMRADTVDGREARIETPVGALVATFTADVAASPKVNGIRIDNPVDSPSVGR